MFIQNNKNQQAEQFHNPANNSSMRILKIIMAKTGTYNDQFIRNYKSTLNNEITDNFMRATHGGTNLSVTAMSQVAGEIIKPEAMHKGIAHIDGGWGQQRLTFMMEIEYNVRGRISRQICSGYTNYDGMGQVDHHGNAPIDPQMVLHFNSTINVGITSVVNHQGKQNRFVLQDSSHILKDSVPSAGGGAFGVSSTISMRPQDVISGMQSARMGAYDEYGQGGTDDYRINFGLGVKKSKRSNSSAPAYLNATINTLAHSTRNGDADLADGLDDILDNSKIAIQDQEIVQDPFIQQFNLQERFRENGTITWGELLQLAPYADDICKIPDLRGVKLPQRGEHNGNQAATTTNVVTTMLQHAVPAIMVPSMLVAFGFTATNKTMTGQIEITETAATLLADGVDSKPFVENCKQRLVNETLRDLSNNGMIPFAVNVFINLQGNSIITVQIDEEPAETREFLQGADALTVPVMAANTQPLTSMMYDINQLTDHVVNNGPAGQHIFAGG